MFEIILIGVAITLLAWLLDRWLSATGGIVSRPEKRKRTTREAFGAIDSFSPTHVFCSDCSATGVAIDKSRNKIAFSDHLRNITVCNFKHLNSVDTDVSGSTRKVSKISIRVGVIDIDTPHHEIIFYDSEVVKKERAFLTGEQLRKKVEACAAQADEWAHRINAILCME
ncbi:MAG: hypothetical protein MPJ79_00855 [Alphaproteobacteria bacterium]|nr:hypothetical protein [Alphaproteobacteria bacterium]MDA7988736.1 hypothetical protein [Alphaproteobacteria bacterium]MDA8010090.1 hypothetical protein [Alphaproteobacteria bacterium]MDA8030284.1 hypothetical protein [Alphaproteobacteria bacterium]